MQTDVLTLDEDVDAISESGLLNMVLLPQPIVRILAPLLDDRDFCALRLTCRHFKNSTQIDFLLRSKLIPSGLIPYYLIQRVLRHQKYEDLEAFIKLIPSIRLQLAEVMSYEPHAEWILFALLNKPGKVQECLGFNINKITDDLGHSVYHFYALGGHQATFKAHMRKFHRGFKFVEGDAAVNEVGLKAIVGGHAAFYNMLVRDYKFPRYTNNCNEALSLLDSAIMSGDLNLVTSITNLRPDNSAFFTAPSQQVVEPILEFECLALALRSGHGHIYDHLTEGDQPLCAIFSKEEAAQALVLAAQFDNIKLVRYFLENHDALKKWQCSFRTTHKSDTVFSRALYGGSKKVVVYLLDKHPELLNPSESTRDLPPLLICAKGRQLSMCRLLLVKYAVDPFSKTGDGLFSVHLAAIGGGYECFKWLAERNFTNDKLVKTKEGETPLHLAARYGQYWFLKQALVDFGMKAFSDKTVSGATLLHYAFSGANIHLIHFLLADCHLSLHQKDKIGNLPLHYAFLHDFTRSVDQEKFVSQCIEIYGTEIFHIKNDQGKTVYDLVPFECKCLFTETEEFSNKLF